MTVSRGDVVLAEFPLRPGERPKRRPALVVQADRNNSRLSNSIFVMITSNTSLASKEPTQVLIDVGTPDGAMSGLAQASAVKCENLHTLPLNVVVRTIGKLPASLMQRVDDALRVSLELK